MSAQSEPTSEVISCRQLTTIPLPLLSELMHLENSAFPPCERLGDNFAPFMLPRTNGLVIAETADAHVAGYLLFARTAAVGLITKLAVGAAFRRRGVGTSLIERGIEAIVATSRCVDRTHPRANTQASPAARTRVAHAGWLECVHAGDRIPCNGSLSRQAHRRSSSACGPRPHGSCAYVLTYTWINMYVIVSSWIHT